MQLDLGTNHAACGISWYRHLEAIEEELRKSAFQLEGFDHANRQLSVIYGIQASDDEDHIPVEGRLLVPVVGKAVLRNWEKISENFSTTQKEWPHCLDLVAAFARSVFDLSRVMDHYPVRRQYIPAVASLTGVHPMDLQDRLRRADSIKGGF